uniref:[histone H3]-dimethyl-L-lysine(36) demethylase n=1 Tax=Cacopsylla melanoneura TaxID=428564 RepID=A0A8D9A856_9HEMI
MSSKRKDRDEEIAEASGSSSQNGGRKKYKTRTRDRKERKLYTDDWTLGDEDIEGKRTFNLQDKLETDRFIQNFVKEMHGTDFNIGYLQRYGFSTPLLFREKTGLGLQVPSSSFSINDIRTSVGSRRALDVMDVNTQKNVEMSMKEWQRYYEDPDKDRLLNVISLEFSHTKLENYVKQPSVVRQIDWVDCVWPRHLKEAQIESTNMIDEMKYPKVQKYCLMSVKGCYTDFHIDFGGTSVWYHILRGSKVFWLIPPTEHNIKLYEQWVLSGKQGDIFFGDTVERCGRITLTSGNTFFIPTGWIHAVYTPKDSLVFGGNFLHSYGIEKQLRVAKVEDSTKVPQKFRYPFFTEMLWYVLEKYVHCLLGKTHLATPDPHARLEKHPSSGGHIHLTPHELHGLKAIVSYLHSLPGNKKSVPELIRDPVELIKDVRTLVEQHRYDSSEKSVTGRPVLRIVIDKEREMRLLLAKRYGTKEKKPKTSYYYQKKERERLGLTGIEKERKSSKPVRVKPEGGPRRRRTRCKKCEACLQADCGECGFCQDMVKFGGQGRAKQTCVMRQCLQPMLPITAACSLCGLDGWGQPLVIPIQKTNKDSSSTLMECSVCYQIVHPDCLEKHFPNGEGMVNEDLPNSWECSKCCADGKNIEYKPRHFRARQKSGDFHRRSSVSSSDNRHHFDLESTTDMNSDEEEQQQRRAKHKSRRVKNEQLSPPPIKKTKKDKHHHDRDRHRVKEERAEAHSPDSRKIKDPSPTPSTSSQSSSSSSSSSAFSRANGVY